MSEKIRDIARMLVPIVVPLAVAGLVILLIRLPQKNGSEPAPPERDPMVLFLAPSDTPELWMADPDGDGPIQLTDTGGQVLDYAPSPTGERIALGIRNEQAGIDLWEMVRNAGGWSEPEQILPCGADFCINPAYSPDGARIAYTRRVVETASGPPGVPRVWLLDRAEGSTDVWTSDPNIGGYEPSWSPDGRYLSFFDGLGGGLRVADMQNAESFLVPSEMGFPGSWSPDGKSLLYVQFEQAGSQPSVPVYQLDIDTRESTPVLRPGGQQSGVEFSVPDWSPDGEWVVVAQRLLSGSPSKQLFIARLDGSEWQAVTDEPVFTHAVPRWDPAGRGVIYQRLALGSSDSLPQIAYWDRATGTITVLSEDGFQPRWVR